MPHFDVSSLQQRVRLAHQISLSAHTPRWVHAPGRATTTRLRPFCMTRISAPSAQCGGHCFGHIEHADACAIKIFLASRIRRKQATAVAAIGDRNHPHAAHAKSPRKLPPRREHGCAGHVERSRRAPPQQAVSGATFGDEIALITQHYPRVGCAHKATGLAGPT